MQRDYLPYLKNKERFLNLSQEKRQARLNLDFWKDVRAWLADLQSHEEPCTIRSDDAVILDSAKLQSQLSKKIPGFLQRLIPWRTGPFNILGEQVDSEWQSNLRWERLKPLLPDLKNALVADIGCGNGYFMFRMLESDPRLIIGLDPQARCIFQFELLNCLLKEKRLRVEPLGIENMDVFYRYFDFVLCMGVIYHRRDPHTCLTKVKESLKPGGKLLLESLIIPGDGAISLSPPDRYMKMRNVWFVPTADCMVSWLEKVGFKKVKIELIYETAPEEQRRTHYSPDESMLDFLDPTDSTKTIEGYPVPKRAFVSAEAWQL